MGFWCSEVVIAVVIAALSTVNAQNLAYSPPFYPSPWMSGNGDWAEAHEKAVQFVSQLTLPEKVNLTSGVGWMQGNCVGNTGSIPRLNFPGFCMQDSPLGVRFTDYVSAFPAGVNTAATWDKRLAYQRGNAMGNEHRNKGVDVQLGPVAGPLGRSPDGGRDWEGFSPDPVFTGAMMAATIKGIQDAGVIACAKHYILNEQEYFRQPGSVTGYENIPAESSNADDKTLHELYLWPFADAVRAGVGSIMCSYEQINNSYGCSNAYTLNKLLKSELDFQGFVTSDWWAQQSGVGTALAGLDMTMAGDTVLNGTVPEWRIDDMAVRIMAAYYKVGRDRYWIPTNFNSWTNSTFGPQHALANMSYGQVNYHVNVQANHGELIRQIGSSSIVLLKNNGALPLTGHEVFTGIFGEDAGANPGGPNACADRSCDNGTLAMGWGSGTAQFPYLITPEEAIQTKVQSLGTGTVQAITDNNALSQMAEVASRASVCLVFGNADSGEGYLTIDGNEGDRKNLTLWQGADQVIEQVSAHCNNTILVLHTAGPVIVSDWDNHPNITAILWAGLPGQESGNSLVDVLYGDVNPGGKSPFTWGKKLEDWGTPILTKPNNGAGAPQIDYSEGIFIDYRKFDRDNITPTYEFGFGLSYTTFEISDLCVEPINAPPYVPSNGMTKAAPSLGNYTSPSDYVFPDGFSRIPEYVYPWINSTDLKASSGDPRYGLPSNSYIPPGATDGSPQLILGAGGAPGGNPGLYEEMYTITATVKNTGEVAGDEVPQLYICLGAPDDPKVALRDFDRISLEPGEEKIWNTALTRRDVSNWDPVTQNWVISKYPKTVYVGNSSRKLPLKAELPLYAD
ncbi:hypothetical protein Egran_01729 [Elaphomyces granulatus]|uniref:beta-glucosidase n=1 Tax=Elaphomyces granulatus TaxID=519963 RepID=A0A232M276_9EURO|nr:hypothetical protein Egran_01729 [Elaphomyces granulatus]